MSAVVILPWAEFMLPRQEHSVMGRTDYLLRNCGIDMADVLHISEETAALKDILQDDRFGKILRINTADDLKELIELLLGRPLCLRITLIHTEVASKYSADKVSIWEGDFAVIINTTNHKIRNQLRGALQTAQSHASRQRPFSLEVTDFGELVEGWYLQNIDVFSGCDDFQSTKTKKARLVITNHTSFNHCFDCSPKWWLCLGPCWLMSAPCYYFYRLFTCKDIFLTLRAPVSSLHGLRKKTVSPDSRSLTMVNYNNEGSVSTALTSDQSQMSELNFYGTV